MKKIQELFPGVVPYNENEIITNPFSGQNYELTGEEAALYDFIIGLQHTIEVNGGAFNAATAPYQKKMRKALDWFRSNNPDAYMILLD